MKQSYYKGNVLSAITSRGTMVAHKTFDSEPFEAEGNEINLLLKLSTTNEMTPK